MNNMKNVVVIIKYYVTEAPLAEYTALPLAKSITNDDNQIMFSIQNEV